MDRKNHEAFFLSILFILPKGVRKNWKIGRKI